MKTNLILNHVFSVMGVLAVLLTLIEAIAYLIR